MFELILSTLTRIYIIFFFYINLYCKMHLVNAPRCFHLQTFRFRHLPPATQAFLKRKVLPPPNLNAEMENSVFVRNFFYVRRAGMKRGLYYVLIRDEMKISYSLRFFFFQNGRQEIHSSDLHKI